MIQNWKHMEQQQVKQEEKVDHIVDQISALLKENGMVGVGYFIQLDADTNANAIDVSGRALRHFISEHTCIKEDETDPTKFVIDESLQPSKMIFTLSLLKHMDEQLVELKQKIMITGLDIITKTYGGIMVDIEIDPLKYSKK